MEMGSRSRAVLGYWAELVVGIDHWRCRMMIDLQGREEEMPA
jgi:hypothetical protein